MAITTLIVLAPCSVQESIDLTVLAFDLAEKYRSIVVVLSDGSIGQMMEAAELPPMMPLKKDFPDWAVDGAAGRERRFLTSIYMDAPAEEVTNMRLLNRWAKIRENEVRYKEYYPGRCRICHCRIRISRPHRTLGGTSVARAGYKSRAAAAHFAQPLPGETAVEALGKRVKGHAGGRNEHRPDAGRCDAGHPW